LLEGFNQAKKIGICNRDIKPGNILLVVKNFEKKEAY
jgi:serine/threonine protein kinase